MLREVIWPKGEKQSNLEDELYFGVQSKHRESCAVERVVFLLDCLDWVLAPFLLSC